MLDQSSARVRKRQVCDQHCRGRSWLAVRMMDDGNLIVIWFVTIKLSETCKN
jgi:hypothetical protein